MSKNFKRPQDQTEIANFSKLNSKNIKIENVNLKTQRIEINLATASTQELTMPLAYFPSWQGYMDGTQIVVRDNLGRVSVNVPQGQHSLIFMFRESKIELIADLISLAGILALFIGIIQLLYKKYA
jgi:uncharacterized membrane protein YfhO